MLFQTSELVNKAEITTLLARDQGPVFQGGESWVEM